VNANDPRLSPGYQASVRVAVVAAALSAVVAALLLYDYATRPAVRDPAEDPEILALKTALVRQADDEELRAAIRAVDERLRRDYFRRRAFTATGAMLLVAGLGATLLAARSAATIARKLPQPEPRAAPRDLEAEQAATGRWAVGALAVAAAGLAVALVVWARADLPPSIIELVSAEEEKEEEEEDEAARWWPRFRGPGGRGVSRYADVPKTWNVETGENVVWKTEVPLPGNNSPVVWGNRVFLSGADETRREVYCFDAGSGALLWRGEVETPESPDEAPEVMEDTGFAAPSTATDGRLVFAMFANGDVGAFDFEGKLAWARSLGLPKNSYGHASSLALYRDFLLVQFDQGHVGESLSKVMALHVADGTTAWEVVRTMPNSWASPIVVRAAGRDQLITAANPWVVAYDPADGEELWRARRLRQDVGPSPTFADGIVYVANEFPAASAIRADGRGDVTDTHVLWSVEDGLPNTCSPLATDEFFFLLDSYGLLTCYDIKTGELLWEEEFDSNFTSSPSLAGGLVYLVGDKGKSFVVEPSRDGAKVVGEGDLGEPCVTSPAFQEKRIFLRGEKHLFCLGE
jgi:outer membrane protein assembly factor BamB